MYVKTGELCLRSPSASTAKSCICARISGVNQTGTEVTKVSVFLFTGCKIKNKRSVFHFLYLSQ